MLYLFFDLSYTFFNTFKFWQNSEGKNWSVDACPSMLTVTFHVLFAMKAKFLTLKLPIPNILFSFYKISVCLPSRLSCS